MIILVLADTIGRSIFEPNSIPAGVVVAALGARVFSIFTYKNKINTLKRRTYEKETYLFYLASCVF